MLLSRGCQSVLLPRACALFLTLFVFYAARASAGCSACAGNPLPVGMCTTTDIVHTGSGCGGFNNCQVPTVSGSSIELIPQGGGLYTARMLVTVTAPWNQSVASSNPNGTLDMTWFDTATAPVPWTSGGNPSLCEYLASDRVQTYVEQTNLSCSGAPYNFGTYSLRASTCGGPCPPPFFPSCGFTCGRWVDVGGFQFAVTSQALGCNPPRKWTCPGDSACSSCAINGSGASPAGGGPGVGPALSGPGATLRYAAGGAGGLGYPGSTDWTPALGRFWSHDYAERIVIDPVTGNDSHVWMITRFATFREFSGLSSGIYTTVSPSDEYRKLHRTGSGWELHGLDGSVEAFDSNGLWTSTVDKNGNAKTASYTSGQLTSVTFADGRSEDFTYNGSGKLATITENGVGSGSRVWTYTWSGDTLTRIDRPAGPAWAFTYGDSRFPGYMTRMELVDGSSRRVVNAWEYDASGNVVKTWKGDASFTGPNAVDKWSYSFDDPDLPASTEVTDPLGNVATYEIDRDTVSDKPRVTSISGDCPTCGLGPNSQLAYDDSAHPLKVTSSIDGRGTTTLYSYDANGQMLSKTEAFGTALARTTTWEYSSSFPAFATSLDVPSTSGSGDRHTGFGYNGTGDQTSRTIEGVEDGSAFSYATSVTYNSAGQPLTINPPGYSTTDVTSFTYDSSRGDLLPLTRTDPIIGTTSFDYDPFNRRTKVTDSNSVSTVTAYDNLNRVTSVTWQGATSPADLVTSYTYNGFGDLLRTTLPVGNVIEYGYDSAGRLISEERKPNASTPGERTLYTLDGAGNRTKVELQHWSGSAWVTDSTTQYVFMTRCHPDKVINADSSVREYAYDCNGNLAKIWDENHPSASQTNPATQVYVYDVLNRMTSVAQPWSGGGNSVTTYTYDVQDHLASVTDAEGNPTTYTTSDRDLVTEEVSLVSGTTTYAYNEHSQRVEETDARAVTALRTYDALDRLTLIDYPDDSLDTTYTYDALAVSFSKGRLTSIDRDTSTIAYTYDRFGRTLQDGDLTYSYDKNGNVTTLEYPNAVVATYTYDFADRQSTLQMQDGANPAETLVSASSYKPRGPLSSLALGNGLTESHGYSTRYLPSSISVPSLLSWNYTTDSVGNPTAIADALNSANDRAYAYQDPQYFLTTGDGPWGARSWTYDKIGNRLTETNDFGTDTFTYVTNGTGGNTPLVDGYSYDAAGDLLSSGLIPGTAYGDDRRVAGNGVVRPLGNWSAFYDGRGFLREVLFPEHQQGQRDSTHPTYSSAGLLLHRNFNHPFFFTSSNTDLYFFYFAGRPVATLENVTATTSTSTLSFLTTDHLGTPILITDGSGAQVWQGGFEPFGADYSSAPTPLRFPGQWIEDNSGLYYNVNRWYDPGTGRYGQPDPEWADTIMFDRRDRSALGPYLYADDHPLVNVDPLGLLTFHYGRKCRNLPSEQFEALQQAAADAAQYVPLTPQCAARPRENVHVACKSCGGNCGTQYMGGRICVNLQNNQGGKCGAGPLCLASTILHEVVHTCGGSERESYACERRFYPQDVCRAKTPDQYLPTPDNPCPCGS